MVHEMGWILLDNVKSGGKCIICSVQRHGILVAQILESVENSIG